MSRRTALVVDTDTGVDDAMALMLLASRRDVELVAVHSTFGNCRADQAANNALYLLETCGISDLPVHVGLEQPLESELRVSSHVHGEDGFGNTWVRPQGEPTRSPDAVEHLLELVRERPGELDYLALGPTTNLAAALRREPGLIGLLRSVTIVGSLGPAMYKDAEPWLDRRFRVSRDPNVACDAVAAWEVGAAEGDVTWCGPYITRQALVPESLFAAVAEETGNPPAQLITAISRFYAEFYTRSYPETGGVPHMGINDSLAAAVVVDPGVVLGALRRPMQRFVDDAGVGYIAGVHPDRDESRPLQRVVYDVDFDRVIDMLEETLRTPLPWPAL